MSAIFKAAHNRATAILIFLMILFVAAPPVFAAKKLDGRWALTITIPESPGSSTKRTLTVTLDAAPRAGSLHGRVTITDAENRTVIGAWRQSGKNISIAYEMPCPEGGETACATLILTGKMKNQASNFINAKVIVMWDTPNANNPALFDTAVGSFSGQRLP